ncbi:hypothetical protein Ddye_001770 [Dipteronia dyeriana]|uniref:GDSL esterase/lipase 7 n=1 Tax=Dipteronia dyeriana TaxID=168575 RepID=A0AAD9XP17_9ROSI|nr:hypothetical protein Ddye_001770 [Dipteronia dyeriana]
MKQNWAAIFFFFLLHFFPMMMIISSNQQQPLAPALYVFGDSLFDSGNNNNLLTIAKANYLPYGFNFIKASGRFTNGKTIPDFIAEFLGLPYAPPYRKSKPDSVVLTGLNYASGACGILPETGLKSGACLRLSKQVKLFEETVKWQMQTYYKTSQELSYYLSKSLFLITIGSNDYISNYLDDTLIGKIIRKRISPDQFAQLLIDRLSDQLKRLYDLGGRKMVLFELGPIGCIPSITRKQKHSGKCVENTNQVISFFNNKLPGMLRNLTSTLQGSNFVLGHANWLSYDAVINPSKYGRKIFLIANRACCGNGRYGGDLTCLPLQQPCTNRSQYIFWDSFHPTQAVNAIVAKSCYGKFATNCYPISIDYLAQL